MKLPIWYQRFFGKTLSDRLKRYFYDNRGKWNDHRNVCKHFEKLADTQIIFEEIIYLNKEGILNNKDEFEQKGNIRNHVYLYRISQQGMNEFAESKRHLVQIAVAIVLGILGIVTIPKSCSSEHKEPQSADSAHQIQLLRPQGDTSITTIVDSVKNAADSSYVLQADSTKKKDR